MILSGTEIAADVRHRLSYSCRQFEKRFSRKPCLAVVLAGSNPASASYVRGKKKACLESGINNIDAFFDDNVSENEIIDCVQSLNENPDVDGILVQLPLPSQIDARKVIQNISVYKDVDGFTPANMGNLLTGCPCIIPCTPKGIMRILDSYGICSDGKNVCIIGRSNIVGKPVAALLLQNNRNATVTVCHSKTADMVSHTRQADIVICAAGHPDLIDGSMIKQGAVVIDVGINRIPDSTRKTGYRIVGDADFISVSERASAVTPVPGGVGPMTVAMLMENTFVAACMQKSCGTSDFGYIIE